MEKKKRKVSCKRLEVATLLHLEEIFLSGEVLEMVPQYWKTVPPLGLELEALKEPLILILASTPAPMGKSPAW